ncbi:MAG: hypothetical protein MUF00_18985, partial [Gemmatimonadaceae bacterium]|nr:hypothetical protein [Gemmatimonadaceae bacterium]
CMFHGSDSRPPFLDGQTMAADRGVSIDQCVAFAAQRRANIALLSRYAHIMVDSPLAAHFHVSRCVNVLAIGIPFAQRAVDDAPLTQRSATRILHSPSHPETKGTPLVRRAIESLRARGHDIDYVEITGQPHDVVMRELRSCDLVVDQAYSDTPMAGFATEAAGFGRAVVVGTLGVEQFERWIRPDDLPPTRCVVPERIEDAIAELLDDPVSRDALGARARTFVTSHRDPAVVAARFIRLFTGDVPDEWWFDPADVTYTGGCGSPAVIRRTIRAVVEQRGPAALQLEDKPSLRDAIIRFGYDEGPVPTSTAPVHHTDAVSAPFPS